jgi:protein-disulfide isomerase
METPSIGKNLLSPENIGNPWFVVSIGLLGIIIGYALGSSTNVGRLSPAPAAIERAAPSALNPTPSIVPTASAAGPDDDPFLGKANAPVTLIEFTDYQCPFCKRHFDQTVNQIKQQYIDTGKVKYVVRDFPLSIHPNAPKASEATECAEDQSKFWEMHDILFQKQSEWSNAANVSDIFKRYATDLGLNANAFNTCLDSGKYDAEVKKDFADGSAAGISGTPGFWIIGKDGKGEMLSGAQPFASFQAAFERYLQ